MKISCNVTEPDADTDQILDTHYSRLWIIKTGPRILECVIINKTYGEDEFIDFFVF